MLDELTLINKLILGQNLDFKEAKVLCEALLDDKIASEKKVSILTLLARKDLKLCEYSAFLEVMLSHTSETDFETKDVLDVCGTGGDGKNSFNISTCVAFLLASSGIKVTKHGNYSSSSMCGSSNVLEELGIKFLRDLKSIKKSLDQTNISYLHAPFFHPALKSIGPIRKNLGFRTIFNLLGPLANPFVNCKRLCGVATLSDIQLYQSYLETKENDFFLVHSYSGYDEISLTSKWKLQGCLNNDYKESVLSPKDLGFTQITDKDISAGDSLESAKEIFENVLKGEGSNAQNEVVVANAIFAYKLFNPNQDLLEIKKLLMDNLLSGKPFKTFLSLKEFTN